MKVSIITICYNRVSTIGLAIESVLRQSYPDIEYVVVDGKSTDGTCEKIASYGSEISKFISEPDSGMYAALNKAICLATGDIIGLLHSDDVFYADDTISRYVEYFHSTGADLVYANGQYITPPGPWGGGGVVKRIYRSGLFKKCYLNLGWIPLHTTIFVRKEVFNLCGLYNESYSIASDYEISQRWFREDKVKKVFLDEWVVKMRLGGKSTNPGLQRKKSEEDMRVIRHYGMWGYFTLACKILQKIPQYLLPRIFNYE